MQGKLVNQGKTVNQVVAGNVRLALDEKRRKDEKEWTYEKVAQRLTDNGLPQTRQNVHKKLRSESGRESAFTANELLAFSRVFEKPVLWFLLPQPHHTVVGAGEEGAALPVTSYLNRLFADPHGDVARRLAELGASNVVQDSRALHDHLVAAELDDLLTVGETLRGLADRFSAAGYAVHEKLARAYSTGQQGPTYQQVLEKEPQLDDVAAKVSPPPPDPAAIERAAKRHEDEAARLRATLPPRQTTKGKS